MSLSYKNQSILENQLADFYMRGKLVVKRLIKELNPL